ncbi:MAG TPA: GNAT family protein [Candidatus Xenobia bacterium]|jgi:RimJ/RimL family protein N-acetyltransferase
MDLRLVPYRPEYLEPFLRWRQQATTVRYNPVRDLDRAGLVAMLEGEGHDLSDYPMHTSYRWFVALDGEVMGSICLKDISIDMRYAEIGYSFGEAWHGRGLGTAAVRLALSRIWAQSTLRKLLAYVHVDNLASWRLLERLGFQREGLLREHFLIQGAPADEALYGLLRSEWSG